MDNLHRGSLISNRISLRRCRRKFFSGSSLADFGVRKLLLALMMSAGALISGWIGLAQAKPTLPTTFEVASIRPTDSMHQIIGIFPTPGRFEARNVRLQDLIGYAYHPTQLEGMPSWARSRRYIIQAVMPSDMPHLPRRQLFQLQNEMLRSLLANRFRLKVHWATKLLPVYELVVAKGGPKMKLKNDADYIRAHHAPGPGSWTRFGVGSYSALGNSSGDIAAYLTPIVKRKVIDKTGLTGLYDFDLTWTPWRSDGSSTAGGSGFGGDEANAAGMVPAPDFSGLSIFTAIREQLGLKLKPAKAPVRVLVIDHVEPPTPN